MAHTISLQKADLSRPVRLNPLQQWEYFTNPRETYHRFSTRYTDFAPLHFQGQDYIMPLTPEAVQAVFTADPDGYVAFWKESFSGLNGEGSLWVLEGEKHRRERKLFAPAVHAHYFRRYGEVIRKIVQLHMENWGGGGQIRALDTTLAIALDTIMRLVFGVVDGPLIAEGRRVIHRLTHSAHPLIVFYPKLQRAWFPLWRKYISAKEELYTWFDQVIALRRSYPDTRQDVLGVLLSAEDEHGIPYADLHIKNELLSVLTAGHVTTAVALAWALYELGRHPEVVRKLREELDPLGDAPDANLLIPLPYLEAVFNETIRLHPILSECARVVTEPMEVLGYSIQPGQAFVVSINGLHHNPKLYPEPYHFRPERFIERKYSNFEFLPFGGGHRRCLGAGLAEYTIRIALSEIVRHWELETTHEDFDIRNDLAMGPKYGVRMKFQQLIPPMVIHNPASSVSEQNLNG